MKLDKKTLRSLSLAFFVSGLIVAGANIFADDSALTDASENEENYQVSESSENERDSSDIETTEEQVSDSADEETSDLDSGTEEDSLANEETKEEDTAEEEETDDLIEVVINPSEDSYSVVDKLDQAGIIENPDEFNEFLDYYDYARRIQPGSKELSPAMSYEEIAQILTTY